MGLTVLSVASHVHLLIATHGELLDPARSLRGRDSCRDTQVPKTTGLRKMAKVVRHETHCKFAEF